MTTHRFALCAWMLIFASPTFLSAADAGQSGFATSDNFTVLTPRQPTREQANAYATEVLDAAEQLRSEIANEWLGQELPRRQGRTIVSVSFEPHRDSGLTWAIDNSHRNYHNLYLTTTPQQALGTTLAHEITHIVLATAYPHPHRLPTWLEEGIASRYDDAGRKQQRQKVIRGYAEKRRWPEIAGIMRATNMHASDRQAYTVSASLTSLLLSLDDNKPKLLECGEYASSRGWDAALQKYYGISGVAELQIRWQRWTLSEFHSAA